MIIINNNNDYYGAGITPLLKMVLVAPHHEKWDHTSNTTTYTSYMEECHRTMVLPKL